MYDLPSFTVCKCLSLEKEFPEIWPTPFIKLSSITNFFIFVAESKAPASMFPSIWLAFEINTSLTSNSPKVEASKSAVHLINFWKIFYLNNGKYRVIVQINNQVIYFSANQRTCDLGENLFSQVFLQVADQSH